MVGIRLDGEREVGGWAIVVSDWQESFERSEITTNSFAIILSFDPPSNNASEAY